jgi:hypothetical protein
MGTRFQIRLVGVHLAMKNHRSRARVVLQMPCSSDSAMPTATPCSIGSTMIAAAVDAIGSLPPVFNVSTSKRSLDRRHGLEVNSLSTARSDLFRRSVNLIIRSRFVCTTCGSPT